MLLRVLNKKCGLICDFKKFTSALRLAFSNTFFSFRFRIKECARRIKPPINSNKANELTALFNDIAQMPFGIPNKPGSGPGNTAMILPILSGVPADRKNPSFFGNESVPKAISLTICTDGFGEGKRFESKSEAGLAGIAKDRENILGPGKKRSLTSTCWLR